MFDNEQEEPEFPEESIGKPEEEDDYSQRSLYVDLAFLWNCGVEVGKDA